ncbi:hypothetical protein D9611_006663 [Ephemerocybe angulata]|uniref:Uncharacterized protein n=1 Tax=Ephemerocybe angulata TaxID=980116 RepID=A0A8H5C754_9AGAR|nr:hypothetical protein D9611_006663 [Tulosesus angulatus]
MDNCANNAESTHADFNSRLAPAPLDQRSPQTRYAFAETCLHRSHPFAQRAALEPNWYRFQFTEIKTEGQAMDTSQQAFVQCPVAQADDLLTPIYPSCDPSLQRTYRPLALDSPYRESLMTEHEAVQAQEY